eukprot:364997-Chlamydomonas_euryale.AAC.4
MVRHAPVTPMPVPPQRAARAHAGARRRAPATFSGVVFGLLIEETGKRGGQSQAWAGLLQGHAIRQGKPETGTAPNKDSPFVIDGWKAPGQGPEMMSLAPKPKAQVDADPPGVAPCGRKRELPSLTRLGVYVVLHRIALHCVEGAQCTVGHAHLLHKAATCRLHSMHRVPPCPHFPLRISSHTSPAVHSHCRTFPTVHVNRCTFPSHTACCIPHHTSLALAPLRRPNPALATLRPQPICARAPASPLTTLSCHERAASLRHGLPLNRCAHTSLTLQGDGRVLTYSNAQQAVEATESGVALVDRSHWPRLVLAGIDKGPLLQKYR